MCTRVAAIPVRAARTTLDPQGSGSPGEVAERRRPVRSLRVGPRGCQAQSAPGVSRDRLKTPLPCRGAPGVPVVAVDFRDHPGGNELKIPSCVTSAGKLMTCLA